MMNANEVIRIGRRRKRQASSTAASGSSPSACLSLANSTIRIAFLHARPTSTIKPIWVKMLLSPPEMITPVMADSSVIGTIRITASGRLQLSYWAASTRNAQYAEREHEQRGVAREDLLISQVSPLVGHAVGQFLFQ